MEHFDNKLIFNSVYGFVPSDNKPFPEPMLTPIYAVILRHKAPTGQRLLNNTCRVSEQTHLQQQTNGVNSYNFTDCSIVWFTYCLQVGTPQENHPTFPSLTRC